jgi:hypothetical protein
MLFNLPTDTECELTSFVGRTQKSGKEDVPAVSFRLKLGSVRNELLDLFSPTMRLTVYAPVEGQEQLPGVELTTPILRSKDLKHWAPETCLEGWTVIVARGITEDSALQMSTCKVDDFRFDFFEGGHMDVDFRVSTADVDEEGAGMLWGRQKRKVFVTVTAPELPEAKPAIDGTTEAFKRDHPGAADGQADLLDGEGEEAGEAFARSQHPDDDDGSGDSEGGQPDAHEGGENWPFPRGEAGSEGSGEPEPEVKPAARGRRSRKAVEIVE